MAKAGPYDPLEIVEHSSEVKSAQVTFFFSVFVQRMVEGFFSFRKRRKEAFLLFEN